MGGVGRYFERHQKPKRIFLPLGLVCVLTFLLFYISTWRLASYHPSRRREVYEAQTRQLNTLSAIRPAEASDIEVSIKLPPKLKSGNEIKRKSRLDIKYKNFKTILYWNDAYGDKSFGFGYGQEPFLAAKCRVNQCYATHDKRLVAPEEADAIVWHLRANNKSLPPKRSPHTFYIFFVMESALYTYADLNTYNGVFNWTMTYRLDSDFPYPYGRIRPPSSDARTRTPEAKNFAAGKTKLAAWFVSNCKTVSDREHLVKTLKSYIDVDIYGTCGPFKCPRKNSEKCFKMLDRDYKFYFSFENSLCMDYITEKFFLRLQHNVAPVVYGIGHKKLDLPDRSYIDVLDFSSLKALANYLLYLDSNDTAYNEYFRWKTMGYNVVGGQKNREQAFCNVCERLHEAHDSSKTREDNLMEEGISSTETFQRPVIKESYRKVYRNLHDWFVVGKCTEPYNNRKLSAFIHGHEVSIEQIEAEAEELPYLLRPNKNN